MPDENGQGGMTRSKKQTVTNYKDFTDPDSSYELQELTGFETINSKVSEVEEIFSDLWRLPDEKIDKNKILHLQRLLGDEKAKAELNYNLLHEHKKIVLSRTKAKLEKAAKLKEEKPPSDAKLTMLAEATEEYETHINGMCYAKYLADKYESDFRSLLGYMSFLQTMLKSRLKEYENSGIQT